MSTSHDHSGDDLCLDVLRELDRCPAVAFYEGRVSGRIRRYLDDLGVSVRVDGYGNLIARIPPGNTSGSDQPPIAFVAHMDHPGFEVVGREGDEIVARALGGVPQACFSNTVAVRLLDSEGHGVPGRTAGRHGPESERAVLLELEDGVDPSIPAAVVLDLPDYRLDGELVRMRAADDLAGCAAIVGALERLVLDPPEVEVYGVFTRAEEVGLVGARVLAEEGTLPREALVVSLEASRSLPGAEVGGGPVIRVGDAGFTFDAEAESALLKAREELSERCPDFKCQRQLMSGGTCEASAFRYHGYRTTGIALPLGNYHNVTPEGGVAEEYIHTGDLKGTVDLMVGAAYALPRRALCSPWRRMADLPSELRQRLMGSGD